jgi:hypothetical protein
VQTSTGSAVPYNVPGSFLGVFSSTDNYLYFLPTTSGTYYIDVADPYAITPESFAVGVTADYTDNPTNPGIVIAGGGT